MATGLEDATLRIEGVGDSDVDNYECVAENEGGEDKQTMALTVSCKSIPPSQKKIFNCLKDLSPTRSPNTYPRHST